MNSFSSEVNLISFGSGDQTSAVHKALIELGIIVRPINNQHWQNGCYSKSTEPSILILGNNDSIQKEILGTISKYPSFPFLALYSFPISIFVRTFLSSCKECCSWPCENQELCFRLERLLLANQGNKKLLTCELSSNSWVKLNLVGSSAVFNKTLSIINQSANCNAPVLIEDETGSGKEMVARAIHYLSDRRDYPFIPVNCGAIPELLIENEFFGHEKGAFTDAKDSQSGVIAQAHGGTIFLDEIEVLSEKGQVVLLRFIEDQNIKPLGAKQCKKVDVRIVAASNLPLSELVSQDRFRQDLLFRLNLISIRLPPLRERISDIEILAKHFLEKFRNQYQQPDIDLSLDCAAWMKQYEWPGNVRELENYVHRKFLLTEESLLTLACQNADDNLSNKRRLLFDRRQQFDFDCSFHDAKTEVVKQFEKRYLNWIIKKSSGNVTQAAKICGQERWRWESY